MQSALASPKQRILSIDILRGIIMLIMALDHVRDYFSNAQFDPLDLDKTNVWYFLTRWITHFCAPTFVFLAGTSAFLSASNKPKGEASLFLLKRGLWLILLEISVIGFGWMFDPGFHVLFLQVIWAIGFSMVVLSALVWLRPVYVGLIGLALIVGHNAFDYLRADTFGDGKLGWMLLHEQGFMKLTDRESIFVLYPVIPWVGVMAAGYWFGTVFKMQQHTRRKWLIGIGLSCLAVFIALRFSNLYGDPFPWQHQVVWWKNILAFIKCHKYPPSLLYLLMTLGISILALAALEKVNNTVTRIFMVYGKVPMFYYLCHIYLIHFSQIIVGLIAGYPLMKLLNSGGGAPPENWGYPLPVVYLIWLCIITILYFPCRWFMHLKQRRKDWWLSYL